MTNPNISTIDVHELKNLMSGSDKPCLIDVREKDEWEKVHIEHALHIPKALLTEKIAQAVPDKTQPVYLHCKGGTRSAFAAISLMELGYSHVYSVNGGISEWEQSGYPVCKKDFHQD